MGKADGLWEGGPCSGSTCSAALDRLVWTLPLPRVHLGQMASPWVCFLACKTGSIRVTAGDRTPSEKKVLLRLTESPFSLACERDEFSVQSQNPHLVLSLGSVVEREVRSAPLDSRSLGAGASRQHGVLSGMGRWGACPSPCKRY